MNKVDTALCKEQLTYGIIYNDIALTVLLNTSKDPVTLYNRICNHPDITPELIINLLKQIKEDDYIKLDKCYLITQKFCEKYKDTGSIHPSIMIKCKVPVSYIVTAFAGYMFNNYELLRIAKYCTYDEYIKYCKPYRISPCLDNPNMTVDWLMDNTPINEIDWIIYASPRPDLFTADAIMKYKDYIPKHNKLWAEYFMQFPVTFIIENIDLDYCLVYCCIDTFKKHPCGVSWHVIDKFISVRLRASSVSVLDMPKSVTDLPRWFVKKYKDYIQNIHLENVNNDVNYKFIVSNGIKLHNQYNDINKCRNKYIALLNDIVDICAYNCIPEDLHECILSYT